MNVDINGIGLNYEDTGSGEVLVLVSGFCSNLRYWKNMVPMLEGYRVVRLDNRGVGDTVYSGDFSIDDMADDIVALMGHLGVDKFSVLGWSMGSLIAQSLAARYPGRLKGVIMVSTYLRRPARSAYLMGNMARMVLDGSASMEALYVAMNALCFTESMFSHLEEIGDKVPMPRKLEDAEGLARQLMAVDAHDFSADAPGLNVPVLIIHGEDDTMVPLEMGEEVYDAIPDSQFLIIGGQGHNMDPRFYAGATLEFLGSL